MRRSLMGLFLALIAIVTTSASGEDTTAAAARTVVQRNEGCIVTVMATARNKMMMGGQQLKNEEQRVEAVGTIVDASGLTVISYTTLDSSVLINAMLAKDSENTKDSKVELSTELVGVKIRLGDGTEIPAKVRLKDTDLDLALVAPDDSSEEGRKMAGKYPSATLEAVIPLQAESVYQLRRLNQGLGRVITVEVYRVNSVILKPQRSLIVRGAQAGSPVFSGEGKLLGISTVKADALSESATQGQNGLDSDMVGGVITLAQDIAEIVKQAREK